MKSQQQQQQSRFGIEVVSNGGLVAARMAVAALGGKVLGDHGLGGHERVLLASFPGRQTEPRLRGALRVQLGRVKFTLRTLGRMA